jgi:sugar-specific transcriptional regulator TrmB
MSPNLDTQNNTISRENLGILESLGLSEQESSAYLTLLKIGGSRASTLAREMRVKRTTIYAILKALTSKNLVLVYFRKSKRFYHAVSPDKISNIFEKKLEAFNGIIPYLQSMEKKEAQALGLRFIETKEELKQYYQDILDDYSKKKNKQYYVISNDLTWENIDPEFFMKFRRQRANSGIKIKLLLSNDSEKSVDIDKTLGREIKYFSAKYKLDCSIEILNNKVIIISHELKSIAVVISIPPMVVAFKTIFEILWDLMVESSGNRSVNQPKNPKSAKA